MSFYDSIILGIIQGLTEFLPISSSGHLVLVEAILGVESEGVSFELMLHLGTLLAILIYFRSRIWSLVTCLFDRSMARERKIVFYLVVGTIPAGLAGLFLSDVFDRAFSSPVQTSLMLLATGLILFSTRFARTTGRDITVVTAVAIGVAQAVAILPGISRSGATIAAGMLGGVKPSEAAEFSFLLAVPAIAGAAVLKSGELIQIDPSLAESYVVGTVTALVFSLLAVHTVLKIIRRGKFAYFSYYCFAAGATGLYLFL